MENIPFYLVLYAGLTHALEADHVLAVSNVVTQRRQVWLAVKDGMYWGFGHTTTILLIGLLMIWMKVYIAESTFSLLEAAVGLMLVVLACYRLWKLFRTEEVVLHSHTHVHGGTNTQTHIHIPLEVHDRQLHRTSYGIGMVHGLAGSGALVVLATAQVATPQGGLWYLLLYGLGSVVGMALVAALFSVPFSQQFLKSKLLSKILVTVTSLLCLAYGWYIIYENLAG